ncbi:MAG: DsrE/DsrF/TusD sulfur relay family protein [Candidatus Bathyarchaeota archaeon]
MAKTLTIVLLTGPYTSQYADIACHIAEKALEQGCKVNLFLYMDGVHVAVKGQITNNFPNIEENLKKLIKKGLKVKACVRCASARGYVEDGKTVETGVFSTSRYVEGVTITGIYELPKWISESEKVIVFGD